MATRETSSSPPSIELDSYQLEHVERLLDVTKNSFIFIDNSRTGEGKTYTTSCISHVSKLPLFVICPAVACQVWHDICAKYDLEVIEIISYDSLKSTSGHQPKHPYLNRVETYGDKGGKRTTFEATEAFLEEVEQGILLVFDEAQYLKNKTMNFRACSALASAIYNNGGVSRIAVLSATLFDKLPNVINFLRLTNYMRSDRLITVYKTGEMEYQGLQDIIDECREVDKVKTNEVLAKFPVKGKKSAQTLAYHLFSDVVKSSIASYIDSPRPACDIGNMYFLISDKGGKQLVEDIATLGKAARAMKETGKKAMKGSTTPALRKIEWGKVEIWHRVANDNLVDDPRCKVIICVNYLDTLMELAELLKKWKPLIIRGKPKRKEPKLTTLTREESIYEFQNNPQRRLVIMTGASGGVSVNLHDLKGGEKRYMYISPDYSIIKTMQIAGRVARKMQKSTPIVRMTYAHVGREETSILALLARKSNVLRNSIVGGEKATFPDEYSQFIEEEL